MKRLPYVLFVIVLLSVSSAWAVVYRWVDRNGVVNFADDASKIPREYSLQAEELNIAKSGTSVPSQTPPGRGVVPSQESAKHAPPVAQNLVREGDFAIKLAEALKVGKAGSEAEAESMLGSVGITPKNGWIADYPVTPDVIGELEKAVGEAADAQKLALGKTEALKALRTAAVEEELPIVAEGTGGPDEQGEGAPPTTPEYMTPSEIDNYYYAEGPPVVTYYPPPWDYYYMYAWIPTPFWCSGFYFPGFFILHDFHRGFHRNGHAYVVTNHRRDAGTGRISVVDPAGRHTPRGFGGRGAPPARGFNSAEARSGARSIFERSHGRSGSSRTSVPRTSAPMTGRGSNPASSVYSSVGRGDGGGQAYNKESRSSGFAGRYGNDRRQPATNHGISRTPGGYGSRGMNRNFGRPEGIGRQNGMNLQRSFAGQARSFNSPSQGSPRSFNTSPQAGSINPGSSPTGTRDFGGSHQGRGAGGGAGQGGRGGRF